MVSRQCMVAGGHFAKESGGCNVVGGGKTVSTEEDLFGLEPRVEGVVMFKLPEGLGGVDVDVETDGRRVFLAGFVVGSVDAGNVLVEVVARRDVTFLRDGVGVGGDCDGEDGVVGIDMLEFLEEFTEKGLDGVGRGIRRGTDSINTENSFMERGVLFWRGKEGGCGGKRGRRRRGGNRETGVGAVIVGDVHGVDRRAEVRRN